MKFSLLVLRCENLEASKNFYEMLGMMFVSEQHGKGLIHYSSNSLGFIFELYPMHPTESIDNSRLGFEVDESEAIFKNMESFSSYELYGQPIHIFKDPDGRKIEISKKL
jgi:lactoylglutathione lyase